jgi:hypothetical protein
MFHLKANLGNCEPIPHRIQNFISQKAFSTPTNSKGSAKSDEGKFQMYRPIEDVRYVRLHYWQLQRNISSRYGDKRRLTVVQLQARGK